MASLLGGSSRLGRFLGIGVVSYGSGIASVDADYEELRQRSSGMSAGRRGVGGGADMLVELDVIPMGAKVFYTEFLSKEDTLGS